MFTQIETPLSRNSNHSTFNHHLTFDRLTKKLSLKDSRGMRVRGGLAYLFLMVAMETNEKLSTITIATLKKSINPHQKWYFP